jgi:hypothetical protein
MGKGISKGTMPSWKTAGLLGVNLALFHHKGVNLYIFMLDWQHQPGICQFASQHFIYPGRGRMDYYGKSRVDKLMRM